MRCRRQFGHPHSRWHEPAEIVHNYFDIDLDRLFWKRKAPMAKMLKERYFNWPLYIQPQCSKFQDELDESRWQHEEQVDLMRQGAVAFYDNKINPFVYYNTPQPGTWQPEDR